RGRSSALRRSSALLRARTPEGGRRAPPLRGAPGAQGGRALDGRRALVEQEPVEAQRAHRLLELVEVYRLDDVAVDAEVVALHLVPLLVRGGHHDDGDPAGAGVGLDLAQDL